MKVLVTGAGGFIGGHLVAKLLKKNYKVICCDIKPLKDWYQVFSNTIKYPSIDLNNYSNCIKLTKKVNFVFNLACNMGGMGFIENNIGWRQSFSELSGQISSHQFALYEFGVLFLLLYH